MDPVLAPLHHWYFSQDEAEKAASLNPFQRAILETRAQNILMTLAFTTFNQAEGDSVLRAQLAEHAHLRGQLDALLSILKVDVNMFFVDSLIKPLEETQADN